jgi:uncharacterized membrane protein
MRQNMNTKLRIWILGSLLAGANWLVACGDDLPDMDADCSSDVPAFADVTAFEKCSHCHSSKLEDAARNGAPTSINFDSEPSAKAAATKAASEVNGGHMPPPNSGITLDAQEKQALYEWAMCN